MIGPTTLLRPVQCGDQGISPAEQPHAEAMMRRLFDAADVDMVTFYDTAAGEYELRARDGRVRWRRLVDADGAIRHVVTSRSGHDPIPSLDPTILRTVEQEQAAAGGDGRPVPRGRSSYPNIYARLSQLFDHARAPDFAIIPGPGGDAHYRGGASHGAPDIVQSRAPLVIMGPGIAAGAVSDAVVALEDIAPTVAQLVGVAPVLGTDATGRKRSQWLRWQDGRSIAPADARRAQRAIVITVDGMSQTAMLDELAAGGLPNIQRLMRGGTTWRNGAIAQYPTVTWPNHNTIVTGASPGHTGIVNNTWYDRASRREHVIVSDHRSEVFRTDRLLDPQVETLYEAVRRTFGNVKTLAVNQPSGRGASVSTLDFTGIADLAWRLPGIGAATLRDWQSRQRSGVKSNFKAIQDAAASAMLASYYGGRGALPKLSVVEFSQVDGEGHEHGPHSPQARTALRAVDRYIGDLLRQLDARGATDSTAIVLTSDHGMEPQGGHAEHASYDDGWKQALQRAARIDGARAIESTRFVYVRNVQVTWSPPAADGLMTATVVDDDRGPGGSTRAVAGAKVTARDTHGRTTTLVTDERGRVRIDPRRLDSAARLVVEHPEYSRQLVQVPTA